MRRRDPYASRSRSLSPMVLMLLMHIYREIERLPHKPPVTIGLLAANIVPFIFDMNIFGFNLSNIEQNCIQPRIIVQGLLDRYKPTIALNRLILPAFMHADDRHLYYNMLSLCWKGINLERELGSSEFLQLVAFSLVVSHSLMIALAHGLYLSGFHDYQSGYNTCAIGFSAVLFSLKYVWNQMCPEVNNVMGFAVPSKYAAWAELVVISLITPNASFIGHLSGILAGILYLHGYKTLRRVLSNSLSRAGPSTGTGTRYTYASGRADSSSSTSQYPAGYQSDDLRNRRTTRFNNN